MATKHSRRLVIDASIMRASGQTMHRTSSSCRMFLEEILKVCHRVVVSPAVRVEWRRHNSSFAASWQARMATRGKLLFVDLGASPEVDALIAAIGHAPARDAAAKDRHLLDAALLADLRVAALDDRALAAFRESKAMSARVGRIMWMNPVTAGADGVRWLRRGAPRRPAWNMNAPDTDGS